MREYNTVIELNMRVREIKEYHFFRNFPCPVDLALERAGYPHMRDKGLGLVNEDTREYFRPREIFGYTRLQKAMSDAYRKLDNKDMVEYAIKAKLKMNL